MAMKLKLPGGSTVSLSKQQTRVTQKGNYGLTALGKVQAEEGRVLGNRGRVLAAVEAGGYSTPGEIAQEAGLPLDQTKQILNRLIKMGYVQQEYEGGQ